jgi:hypothetical protein
MDVDFGATIVLDHGTEIALIAGVDPIAGLENLTVGYRSTMIVHP